MGAATGGAAGGCRRLRSRLHLQPAARIAAFSHWRHHQSPV